MNNFIVITILLILSEILNLYFVQLLILGEIFSFKLKVFKRKILKQILSPKRDDIEKRRKTHNEELHSFYRSPNIVRIIKSRKLR